jgi:hypothetical protein
VTSRGALPNFLIIGAMKAGTTSLWQYLRSHPQVFMPDDKELHFFSREHVWSRGLDWYQGKFEVPPTATAIGEASPSYSKHPHLPGVPIRIATVIPDARLIYVIRQPIERMRSHYLHHVATGQEHDPIETALRPDSEYVNTSRYAMQIACYLEHFRRDQLLIVESEDLRSDRVATLRRVYEFLGIDDGWLPPTIQRQFYRTAERRRLRSIPLMMRRLSGSPVGRLIPDAVRARVKKSRVVTRTVDEDEAMITHTFRGELQEVMREDVSRLRQFLGPDFDGWGLA